MSKRDYYEILEITRSATDVEIKSSYRKLAMSYHPDRNPGNQVAEEKFKEAAEAYAILADTEKRSLYDRFGHAGVSSAAGAGGFDPSVFTGFEDILGGLGDIFGFGDLFGGGRRRGGPQRGADLRYDLEITFEESARGAETTIQIPRQETCETCHGSGAAQGSTPTQCPQCRGQGQVRFQQGFFTVARTCPQCRGAGKIITNPCKTCQGAGRVTKERKITVKVPQGIATGQQLRLQGEGESGAAGGPAGHLYVVIHVHEHEFFRRDGNNLFCEVPVNFTTVALGGEIQVPTSTDLTRSRFPKAHRPADAAAAQQGDAGRERRGRRSVRDRTGRTEEARGNSGLLEQLAKRCRRTSSAAATLRRQDERTLRSRQGHVRD